MSNICANCDHPKDMHNDGLCMMCTQCGRSLACNDPNPPCCIWATACTCTFYEEDEE